MLTQAQAMPCLRRTNAYAWDDCPTHTYPDMTPATPLSHLHAPTPTTYCTACFSSCMSRTTARGSANMRADNLSTWRNSSKLLTP
ncbi:uncharacterized protein SCHCODRAFT_02036123 [Schizophyllum commune H4-8]|uniref:uncharacterized protein n=1 Tax=Schizophyllum commune (strain H4-8 / FGSC 9210) TaxID=578458 RepID=UPI00215F859F|nr:uncharacterized protein SCHCODRAFT_02036123 [Schizophyllum commune H4-8]KAI5900409.1 hypothetical protein SCHCODRAFT_02036123 [Schizophyllum commune H4-8]